MSNQAFLILTNRNDRSIFNLYSEFSKSLKGLGKVHVLFHQTKHTLPKWIRRCNNYSFSYDSLAKLQYRAIAPTLVPGSNHFPVLEFFNQHPQYDYYWCIEDDVSFTGEWNYFFNSFDSFSHDFLTCHIQHYVDDPFWYWWRYFYHPNIKFPLEQRIKSFNPIYRVSNSGLIFLHDCLQDDWCGHHEVLIPTLLNYAGYKIGDIGGEGKFVLPEMCNKFYKFEPEEQKQFSKSTVRFRPIMNEPGLKKNMLYHPVKPLTRTPQIKKELKE